MPRPHVLLSVATSIDGYIDDNGADRLILSTVEDFARVDRVRSESDAILIGAETLRRDNPRLLVKDDELRANRLAHGLPEHPLKVTLTRKGKLDPSQNFWHCGGEKLIYTVDDVAEELRTRIGTIAEVVSLGAEIDFSRLLEDLHLRGIRRLMVEGGQQTHTSFLSAGLVDEIQLAIAPIIVGQEGAARFLGPAHYPGGSAHRMRLVETQAIGDMVLLRYLPVFTRP